VKWVLLRINDEAVQGFITKAGRRVVWVGDIPTEFCECEMNRETFIHWQKDEVTRRPVCLGCGLPSNHYVNLETNLGIRLRYALGRNILDRFRS
jgi:hypothetical protein